MPQHVAQKWYECRSLPDGVTQIHEIHVAAWLRCNIWHVRGRDRDLIIDTGMGLRPLTREIAQFSERPITAIMTHAHFDHAGGLHEFSDRCGHKAEAEIIAKPSAANTVADAGYVRAETFSALPYEGFSHAEYRVRPAPLTRLLDEGDGIDLGDRIFNVFHLPGHSPGSIALYEKETGIFFSGDVVYDGALIDDLYHSDPDALRESLVRLKTLPVRTIHGGHYASFGRDRMLELIDGYLDGGNRVGDAEAWIARQMSAESDNAEG